MGIEIEVEQEANYIYFFIESITNVVLFDKQIKNNKSFLNRTGEKNLEIVLHEKITTTIIMESIQKVIST